MVTSDLLVEIQVTQDEIRVAQAAKEAAWDKYRQAIEKHLSERYTIRTHFSGCYDEPDDGATWEEFKRAWLDLERLRGKLGKLMSGG